MAITRIIALVVSGISICGCSEHIDEETLKDIEARLSAIENIDARISTGVKEKALIEIELREVQEAIERIEARQLEVISKIQDELARTRFEGGGSFADLEDIAEEFRELADQNVKLTAELERIKSTSRD